MTPRTARRLLDRRRAALLARYSNELARIDEELAQHPVELVDVANDQWDARTLSWVGERDARALTRIVAALRRIDAGRYGRCTKCGHRIAAARLRAVPEAGECAECAFERAS